MPEDPNVNLALAPLAVAANDDDYALRYYYRYALDGEWRAEDAAAHRAAFEFVRYLLGHGARERAVSELIVLARQSAR